jgi:hypothetical protein
LVQDHRGSFITKLNNSASFVCVIKVLRHKLFHLLLRRALLNLYIAHSPIIALLLNLEKFKFT